jgi:predicted oxidoreductase
MPTSRLAYGLWRYREDETDLALAMLEHARAAGIVHFDTADIYGDTFGGAERLLGVLRKRASSLFEGVLVATKGGIEPRSPYNSSHTYIARACEASLTRLGVERIDLYYIHRPDLMTHPAELAATLDTLVAEGKIAAIGVSNFTPHQIDALAKHLRTPLAASQIEFSAAHVEPLFDGALDQAMRDNFKLYAWSPLAGGRLLDGGAEHAPVREKLNEIAQKYDVSPEAAALAFLLDHPAAITPIIGTKTPERLTTCLEAQTLTLSRADWYAILEARLGRRMP